MRKSIRNKTSYSRAQRALEICHEYDKRIPKLEKLIASEKDTAYVYAFDIIKGAFPEGEEAILRDHVLATEYAFYVLDAPFEKAHPIIFGPDSKLPEEDKVLYLEFLVEKGYDMESFLNKSAEHII